MILEGALGGSALFDSAPVAPDLTLAQRALVDRVARSLMEDLELSIKTRTGLELTGEPETSRVVETDAMYVVCEVENLSIPAAIIIAASSEVLVQATGGSEQKHEEFNPDMLAALGGVEVEAIAELGRVTLPLRRAMDLAVGDILRLNTADDDFVRVCVGGLTKFDAIPVTSRGQMAVEIRSRHGR